MEPEHASALLLNNVIWPYTHSVSHLIHTIFHIKNLLFWGGSLMIFYSLYFQGKNKFPLGSFVKYNQS